MKEKKIAEWLDNPKRLIAAGIIIVIVIVVIALVGNRLKTAISNLVSNIKQSSDENEIINDRYGGQSASYTDSEYNSFAETLYVAMKGAGTDEDSIYAIFRKMKNDVDVVRLNSAFGVREGVFGMFSGGLSAWLHDELSDKELKTANGILTSNGITYQF